MLFYCGGGIVLDDGAELVGLVLLFPEFPLSLPNEFPVSDELLLLKGLFVPDELVDPNGVMPFCC